MLVSVIIPFYKEIDLIGRAVDSVVKQSLPGNDFEVEIIIGNDGDFSHHEIKHAIGNNHKGLQVLIEDNRGVKGPGGARNCAIRVARGEYVAFLDADDFWLEGKLGAQLELALTGADFISTGYLMDDSFRHVFPPKPIGREIDVFRDLGILTSSVMVRRALLDSQLFRDMRFSQDIDLWHRILDGSSVAYKSIDDALVQYSTGGSTRNKFAQARSLWDVMSCNDIPFLKKMFCMTLYAYRGLRNHVLGV